MCVAPGAGCATMSYLPSLYCLNTRGAVRALAPDGPVLLAALLHLEVHHGLRIDAVHAARLFFRYVTLELFAEDQQAFGGRAIHDEPAMLEALLAGRAVRPGMRAVDIRRPKEAAAAAVARLHGIGP